MVSVELIALGWKNRRTNRTNRTIDRFTARYQNDTVPGSNGWEVATVPVAEVVADGEISASGRGPVSKGRQQRVELWK